jgi:hypothetical protein
MVREDTCVGFPLVHMNNFINISSALFCMHSARNCQYYNMGEKYSLQHGFGNVANKMF